MNEYLNDEVTYQTSLTSANVRFTEIKSLTKLLNACSFHPFLTLLKLLIFRSFFNITGFPSAPKEKNKITSKFIDARSTQKRDIPLMLPGIMPGFFKIEFISFTDISSFAGGSIFQTKNINYNRTNSKYVKDIK